MIIKSGLAKDEKGAQVVLLIVMGVAIVIALFFMFSGGSAGDGGPSTLPAGQFIPE